MRFTECWNAMILIVHSWKIKLENWMKYTHVLCERSLNSFFATNCHLLVANACGQLQFAYSSSHHQPIHLNSKWTHKKQHPRNVRPIHFDVPHLLLDDEITSNRSNQTHLEKKRALITIWLFTTSEKEKRMTAGKFDDEMLSNASIFSWDISQSNFRARRSLSTFHF